LTATITRIISDPRAQCCECLSERLYVKNTSRLILWRAEVSRVDTCKCDWNKAFCSRRDAINMGNTLSMCIDFYHCRCTL